MAETAIRKRMANLHAPRSANEAADRDKPAESKTNTKPGKEENYLNDTRRS
jgi:hypothetical protein